MELLFVFKGKRKTVPPAALPAFAKEQFKNVYAASPLAAEGIEAALAAAGDGLIFGEFRKAGMPHFRAFFGIGRTHHMEITAAKGIFFIVQGLCDKDPRHFAKGTHRNQLCALFSQGARVVESDADTLTGGDIFFLQVL